MTRQHYVGIGLGVLHLVIVLYAAFSVDANDLPWLWMLLFPVDFPVSLLTVWGMDVMQHVWGDIFWDEDWKHSAYNYWPFFVHGLLGSLWWGALAIVVTRLLANRKLH